MSQPLPPAAGPSSLPATPAVTAPAGAVAVGAVAAAAAVVQATPALQLSAQAQQALRLQVFQPLGAQLVTQIQSGPQAAAPQWPAAGVAPALREMLSALIAQITAGLPQPQQLVAAQAWPQAWVNALLPASASAGASSGASPGAAAAARDDVAAGTAAATTAPGAGAGTGAGAATAPRLPPMQTWLVQQGVVQTPQGERGFALTLQVPQAWAQLQTATATGALPQPAAGAAPLQLSFSAPAQQLESGALALVLQGAGPGPGAQAAPLRTSALLWLDFQPLQPAAQGAQAAATGLPGLLPAAQVAQQAQAVLQMKNDPWLQMAALQASGQQPREDQRLPERRTGLCTELGCPYRGKASCAQPFCAEMNRVWAAVRVGPA